MATNRWLYVALVDVDADKVGAKVAKMLGKDWDPCGGLCALPAGLARTVFRVPAPGDTKGLGKNKSSHLASSFRRSWADPDSQNPQRSRATPPVLLPRIDQISPESEHDLGTTYPFRVPKPVPKTSLAD